MCLFSEAVHSLTPDPSNLSGLDTWAQVDELGEVSHLYFSTQFARRGLTCLRHRYNTHGLW